MEKLGINFTLLITQIINFLIIMVVLTKFLYEPVLEMIKKRQKKIEEGIATADEMEKKRQQMEKDREHVLKKARDEARNIIAQAKKDAQKEKDALLNKGKEDLKMLQKKAAQELQSEKDNLEKQLTKEAVSIAEAMATKALEDIISPKEHGKLIKRQLAQLEKAYGKKH